MDQEQEKYLKEFEKGLYEDLREHLERREQQKADREEDRRLWLSRTKQDAFWKGFFFGWAVAMVWELFRRWTK